jgi:hypothetical protein
MSTDYSSPLEPNLKRQKKDKNFLLSSITVPMNESFDWVIEVIRKSLSSSLNECQVVDRTTHHAIQVIDAVKELYQRLVRMRTKEEFKDELKEEVEEEIKKKPRLIRERDIRALVIKAFGSSFSVDCTYGCGNTISLDQFYVVSDEGACNACCKECYRRNVKSGKSGKIRVTDRCRRETWRHHNDGKVLGPCYHCGPAGGLIHFYMDAWHAGHDVARIKGGNNSPDNMAPLHPRCNWDQSVQTFREYLDT